MYYIDSMNDNEFISEMYMSKMYMSNNVYMNSLQFTVYYVEIGWSCIAIISCLPAVLYI